VHQSYRSAFPSLVHAAALAAKSTIGEQDFFLLLGLCVRALCERSDSFTVACCVKALEALITSAAFVVNDTQLFVELMNVLNHTLRTQVS
jgi:hypothetical protein